MFSAIGRHTIVFITGYGEMTIFLFQTLKACRKIPKYLPQIVEQIRTIISRSRGLVMGTGAFILVATLIVTILTFHVSIPT
jgi:ABC-type transporter Mla maintaining outer membrane lipid asymmetry permease subunit MlaE